MFKHNSTEFLRRFITVDETWIHHYTPETKQHWMKTGKVMTTVFWNSQGVVLIDYLEKGKTINGEYYTLLEQLNDAIKTKRPHLAKKKVLFHHDNAPAHTSSIAFAKLHELRFELLPHAPYSPDLGPSDFFLFPDMKKWLAGKKFTSNAEVIAEANAYFEGLGKSYYTEGIKKLKYR